MNTSSIIQRPTAGVVPIERLFRAETVAVTRAYSALTRNGIKTIGELIERRNDVPRMRGVGIGTWNVIVGCMMDFDSKYGTNLKDRFTATA